MRAPRGRSEAKRSEGGAGHRRRIGLVGGGVDAAADRLGTAEHAVGVGDPPEVEAEGGAPAVAGEVQRVRSEGGAPARRSRCSGGVSGRVSTSSPPTRSAMKRSAFRPRSPAAKTRCRPSGERAGRVSDSSSSPEPGERLGAVPHGEADPVAGLQVVADLAVGPEGPQVELGADEEPGPPHHRREDGEDGDQVLPASAHAQPSSCEVPTARFDRPAMPQASITETMLWCSALRCPRMVTGVSGSCCAVVFSMPTSSSRPRAWPW